MESFLTMSSSTSENVTTSGRGKKRKASEYATSSSAAAAAAAASSYEPEPIKPEWLELSPELAKIDFQKESIAWNKFVPYSTTPVPCVEIGTGPAYTKESPALCFQLHAICGRARAATLHFPNAVPPIPTPRFMPGMFYLCLQNFPYKIL